MKRKMLAAVVVATLSLAAAGSASAHFIDVDPPGSGGGTCHHVGQSAAAGHNSAFGHSTAASAEQSQAVTFGPPTLCES